MSTLSPAACVDHAAQLVQCSERSLHNHGITAYSAAPVRIRSLSFLLNEEPRQKDETFSVNSKD